MVFVTLKGVSILEEDNENFNKQQIKVLNHC